MISTQVNGTAAGRGIVFDSKPLKKIGGTDVFCPGENSSGQVRAPR